MQSYLFSRHQHRHRCRLSLSPFHMMCLVVLPLFTPVHISFQFLFFFSLSLFVCLFVRHFVFCSWAHSSTFSSLLIRIYSIRRFFSLLSRNAMQWSSKHHPWNLSNYIFILIRIEICAHTIVSRLSWFLVWPLNNIPCKPSLCPECKRVQCVCVCVCMLYACIHTFTS